MTKNTTAYDSGDQPPAYEDQDQNPQGKPATPSSKTKQPSKAAQTLERWITLSNSNTAPNSKSSSKYILDLEKASASNHSNPIHVKGVYDYGATATAVSPPTWPWSSSSSTPNPHTVEHTLTLTRTSITGTFTDDVGRGTISGTISAEGEKVVFIKAYTSPWHQKWTRWEYEGTFAACGIVGQWHYPGDPPPLQAAQRGRFAMWLGGDEGEGEEAVALMKTGRMVMTFGTS